MARIKDSKEKTHKLNERQFNLLRIMNVALNYNELKNKVISGFLYEVAINDLGYAEGADLGFEIDLDKEDRELIIRIVPTEAIQQALDRPDSE